MSEHGLRCHRRSLFICHLNNDDDLFLFVFFSSNSNEKSFHQVIKRFLLIFAWVILTKTSVEQSITWRAYQDQSSGQEIKVQWIRNIIQCFSTRGSKSSFTDVYQGNHNTFKCRWWWDCFTLFLVRRLQLLSFCGHQIKNVFVSFRETRDSPNGIAEEYTIRGGNLCVWSPFHSLHPCLIMLSN